MSRTKEGGAIILPQFVRFSDKGGYYISIDSSNSLVCNKQEPDANCTFEVIPVPGHEQFRFKGANGLYIVQYGDEYGDWFRCDDNHDTGHSFEVIHAKDNQVYLHTWPITKPEFITNLQHPQNYGLVASPYANDDCLFTVSEHIIGKEIHED